jgi:uncharacterized membrane protein HdeD (DUF308 family)
MTISAHSAAAPHSLGLSIERLRGKWGAIVAFGALLTLMGLASLVFAFASTLAMATLNGVFFIISGVAEIGVGMHARSWSRFFLWLIGGALYILTGLTCVIYPGPTAAILTLILGAGLIAAGLVRCFLGLQLPGGPRRAMVFFASGVTFLLGLIIVTNWPVDSLYVLGTLLGVDLLFHGVGWVAFGASLIAQRRSA